MGENSFEEKVKLSKNNLEETDKMSKNSFEEKVKLSKKHFEEMGKMNKNNLEETVNIILCRCHQKDRRTPGRT